VAPVPSIRRRSGALRAGPWILVAVIVVALAAAALGAGRDPAVPRSLVRALPPDGFVPAQNVGFGTLLRLPDDPWSVSVVRRADTGIKRATMTSGPAVLAVWIYPRGRRGPRTTDELRTARDRLVDAAKARDRTFRVISSATTRYDRLPAVELRGTATILGRPRTVRSVHVYAGGREIVLDAYAPARDFRRIDRAVFRPVMRSLRVAPDWRGVRRIDGIAGAPR